MLGVKLESIREVEELTLEDELLEQIKKLDMAIKETIKE